MPLWRVFPWDPDAADGAPFSVRYVPLPGPYAGGRFDLGSAAVLYLAESPAHAVAEVLQAFRGKKLASEHLLRGDPGASGVYFPLSVVQATLPADVEARLPDLADPKVLVELDIHPDELASHDRSITQSKSRQVHAAADEFAGFRWWSALTGDWHVTVLFLDRVEIGAIAYAEPEPLHVRHPAVREAARFLNISLR